MRVNFLLWDEIAIRRIRRGSEADYLQALFICFCFRIHLSFFLMITRLVVTCSLSLVVGDTDDTETAQIFCIVTSGSASPGFQKAGGCNQYTQYSALLSSPFQIFSIAAAKCRVVPPQESVSRFKYSALSCSTNPDALLRKLFGREAGVFVVESSQ